MSSFIVQSDKKATARLTRQNVNLFRSSSTKSDRKEGRDSEPLKICVASVFGASKFSSFYFVLFCFPHRFRGPFPRHLRRRGISNPGYLRWGKVIQLCRDVLCPHPNHVYPFPNLVQANGVRLGSRHRVEGWGVERGSGNGGRKA